MTHIPAVVQTNETMSDLNPGFLPDRVYLERAPHPHYRGLEVVLAFLPFNKVTPYVTWSHTPGEPDSDRFVKGTNDSGDYFKTLPKALAGYRKRIKGY